MDRRRCLGVMAASVGCILFPSVAKAWPWRRRRRSTRSSTSSYSFSGSPAEVCAAKANLCASRNTMRHWGGSFGGARYEGVGTGTTAQAALNACCYTGQRRLAASAVRQGSSGRWFAVKLFW